jgi:hypothetical protein
MLACGRANPKCATLFLGFVTYLNYPRAVLSTGSISADRDRTSRYEFIRPILLATSGMLRTATPMEPQPHLHCRFPKPHKIARGPWSCAGGCCCSLRLLQERNRGRGSGSRKGRCSAILYSRWSMPILLGSTGVVASMVACSAPSPEPTPSPSSSAVLRLATIDAPRSTGMDS